jgi:hypothetical protein
MKRISKRTKRIRPGALFKVGDARGESDRTRSDKPYVMPGAIVEALALPGQTVVVGKRSYEVSHGMVALRVIEGELSDRRDVRGFEAVGFQFMQNVTKNESALQPLNDAARAIREYVMRAVKGRHE